MSSSKRLQQQPSHKCQPKPAICCHFMQACYRAAKAAYNLKQYSKAIKLAAQGLSKDAGAHELEHLQQVDMGTSVHIC